MNSFNLLHILINLLHVQYCSVIFTAVIVAVLLVMLTVVVVL
jgi:hypothetical protein